MEKLQTLCPWRCSGSYEFSPILGWTLDLQIAFLLINQVDQKTLQLILFSLEIFKERPHEIVSKSFHLPVFFVFEYLAHACTVRPYLWPSSVAIYQQVLLEGFLLHVPPRLLDFTIRSVTLHHACHLSIHVVEMGNLILVSMVGQQSFLRLPCKRSDLLSARHVHIIQVRHVAS